MSLDRDLRVQLLADFRLENEAPKDRKRKAQESKRRRWEKQRARYNGRQQEAG